MASYGRSGDTSPASAAWRYKTLISDSYWSYSCMCLITQCTCSLAACTPDAMTTQTSSPLSSLQQTVPSVRQRTVAPPRSMNAPTVRLDDEWTKLHFSRPSNHDSTVFTSRPFLFCFPGRPFAQNSGKWLFRAKTGAYSLWVLFVQS